MAVAAVAVAASALAVAVAVVVSVAVPVAVGASLIKNIFKSQLWMSWLLSLSIWKIIPQGFDAYFLKD